MRKIFPLLLALCLLLAAATAAAAAGSAAPAPPSLKNLPQPQPADFYLLHNPYGPYSIALPRAFGADPLAEMKNLRGPMLLRQASENLLLAVNIADPADTRHYRPAQRLPDFPDKQVLLAWEQGERLHWQCVLSTCSDFYGSKAILQAEAAENGKTCELLYVFPSDNMEHYLAQALYSLNSFTPDI